MMSEKSQECNHEMPSPNPKADSTPINPENRKNANDTLKRIEKYEIPGYIGREWIKEGVSINAKGIVKSPSGEILWDLENKLEKSMLRAGLNRGFAQRLIKEWVKIDFSEGKLLLSTKRNGPSFDPTPYERKTVISDWIHITNAQTRSDRPGEIVVTAVRPDGKEIRFSL